MITSFNGNSEHKLDSKNLVCIPADFRKWDSEEDNHTFVITKGLGDFLYIYPKPEWDTMIEDLISKLSLHKPKHATYLRTITSKSKTVQTDNNGRITIPKYLREYANINKDVTFIGMVNRIELWDTQNYSNHKPSHLSPGDDYFSDIDEINT